VDVNVPGVMAIPVAPVVAQFSMLLAPGFTLVGDAVKDVTFGAEPLDEVAAPQPTSPTQASRARTSGQRSSPAESSPQGLSLFLQNELGESIRDPFVADGHTSLVIADLSCLLVASTESDSWSTSDIGQMFSARECARHAAVCAVLVVFLGVGFLGWGCQKLPSNLLDSSRTLRRETSATGASV
jgi:hypothetical protein